MRTLHHVATFILLFFMLTYGSTIHDKLRIHREPTALIDTIVEHISSYLTTITTINIALGALVALAMFLIGMPNPLLWGAMCALFNYIPYIGDISGTIVVFLVALPSYTHVGQALLAPAVYYAFTAIEGGFITPMILGRRFQLNPIFIVIGILFFGWLWGIPGALIAVPLLMAIKITFDHVRVLQPLGDLMSL